MSKIKVMDELLANKIAAGEVVERCASVVKELVENSIDAKSTEIRVDLIEAGTKEIKVTDNGIGMDREDAVLAFQRHATSKLVREDDLYHICTLGFRGEALASIASVSEVTLKTSTGDVGTIVSINGGKLEKVDNCDARKGTIITVANLFYNTPARLKHMKSLYTELASITDYINKLALSRPDIKFILTNNNSTLLNTDGSDNLLKTISSIYGISTARKMLEISSNGNDYDIEGYITLPEVHRSSRNNMITLVNGRIVRNSELNRAINDAYHTYKPDNRYPITVLKIEVDPSLIDVNIHPTKQDIKFSKMTELIEQIDKMIKDKLSKKTLIPKVDNSEVKVEYKEPKKYEELKLDFSSVFEKDNNYQEDLIINNDFTNKKEMELNDNNETIEEKEDVEAKKERLPELYPVGLVHGTYIICQNNLGMYLIDQHAAKERINYEIYSKKLSNQKKETTSLLFPINIELSNSEFIILKQNIELLNNIGIEVEEFGVNSIIVKSAPTWLPKDYEDEAIRKIIDLVIMCEKDFTIAKFNDSLAKLVSCKMSIKANTNITLEEMENLINDLRKCDNPFNCPHGRPTIIFYSTSEIEKLFKRSGF